MDEKIIPHINHEITGEMIFSGIVPLTTRLSQMKHLDKRIEAVLNAAVLLQVNQVASPSCYQMSGAIAGALTELGIPAHAHACDVYGWNRDYLRHKCGEEWKIVTRNKNIKQTKKDWRAKKNPQRKVRSRKTIEVKKPLDPHSISLFHEQIVDGNGYDGHVICIADGWVLDATAAQFHRPQKKLIVPPIITIPLDNFVTDYTNKLPELMGNWMSELISKQSLQNGKFTINAVRKGGSLMYCLRPDIKPDNWLNHTDTAKENISWTKNEILKLVEKHYDLYGDDELF